MWFTLLFLTLFLILLLTKVGSKRNLIFSSDAFCRQSYSVKNRSHALRKNHPLQPPNRHIPWVWDAVYDSEKSEVNIVTVSQNCCSFNIPQWKKIVQLFPQFADHLANGSESNVLVPTNETLGNLLDVNNAIVFKDWKRATRVEIICIFLQNKLEIQRTKSLRLEANKMSSKGTIQIKCPVPTNLLPSQWNQMQLERIIFPEELDYLHLNYTHIASLKTNKTETFPVCHLPKYQSNPIGNLHFNDGMKGPKQRKQNNNEVPYRKPFNLSVCTTTNSHNRTLLVEWIEYHLLQGVNHFFIYNIRQPANKQYLLRDALSDYIRENIVTIVPWPYSECVRGMASGRYVQYYDYLAEDVHFQGSTSGISYSNFHNYTSSSGKVRYNSTSSLFEERPPQITDIKSFYPPQRIVQTSAHGSCMARFKHTSKYIASMDVDEFFIVKPESRKENNQPKVNKHKATTKTKNLRFSDADTITDNNNNNSSNGNDNDIVKHSTVFQYIEYMFSLYPKSPAVYFEPIQMAQLDCSKDHKQNNMSDNNNKQTKRVLYSEKTVTSAAVTIATTTTAADITADITATTTQTPAVSFPRLGVWNYAEIALSYEGKLIVRTDIVETFGIHTLQQLTLTKPGRGNGHGAKIIPTVSEAAILHYKDVSLTSKSIWGRYIPFETDRAEKMCQSKNVQFNDIFSNPSESHTSGTAVGSPSEMSSNHHYKLSIEMIEQLSENYQKRMIQT